MSDAGGKTFACAVCARRFPKSGEFLHRACGHHTCFACIVPLLRAGKAYCVRCAAPTLPTEQLLGNLVLGGTAEQNERVALLLRAERAQAVPQGASCSQ